MSDGVRYWVGVASKEHVDRGVDMGICQFCHGKQGPAKRPKKGDFVVYYSSKITMGGAEPCQKFTALGIITDEVPYQVDMGNGFKPFRRNVSYLEAEAVPIKPLIQELPFIKNKTSWGYVFRYGFLEIDSIAFDVIAQAMLGYSPSRSERK